MMGFLIRPWVEITRMILNNAWKEYLKDNKILDKDKDKLKLVITNPVGEVIYEMELNWSHDQIERFQYAHNIYIEGEYIVNYRAEMDDLKLYPKRSDAKLIRGTSIDRTKTKQR